MDNVGMSAAFFVFAAGAAPAGCVACWWPVDEFGRGDTGAFGGVAGTRAGGGRVMAGAVAPALKRLDLDRGDPQGDRTGSGQVVEMAFEAVGVVAVVGAVPVLGELGPLQ